jgi:hypothetical protein
LALFVAVVLNCFGVFVVGVFFFFFFFGWLVGFGGVCGVFVLVVGV